MENNESLTNALSTLKQKGYEADFATETFCLYCSDLDLRLNPESFHVDEIHRFEEPANPDDNAVLYAISSTTGVRGILIDAHGAEAEHLNVEMTEKLQGPSAAH